MPFFEKARAVWKEMASPLLSLGSARLQLSVFHFRFFNSFFFFATNSILFYSHCVNPKLFYF